jgi:RNA polymerase sigma-70 factor (ECF subfamily)
MDSKSPPGEAKPRSDGLLPNTMWSVILRARDGADEEAHAALERLCRVYYEPLRICVGFWLQRRRAFSRAMAEGKASDYLQSFFEVLLRRDFLRRVDRTEGRFRSFILKSLDNFMYDEWDKERAAMRGGGQAVGSLEETDEEGRLLHEPASRQATPDHEVDQAWARAVLENAMRRLQNECERAGKGTLFEAVKPVLRKDSDAPAHVEIAQRLCMSEGALNVALTRLREKLREIIQEEVKETVMNKETWREELRALIEILRS